MYEIILTAWYQEKPFKNSYESLEKKFNTIEEASKYLGKNIEFILDQFPVDGEIKIKYNKKLKK